METSDRPIYKAYKVLTSELQNRKLKDVAIFLHGDDFLEIDLPNEALKLWLGYREGYGYFISTEKDEELRNRQYFQLNDDAVTGILNLLAPVEHKSNDLNDISVSNQELFSNGNSKKIVVYINEGITLREFINILAAFESLYNELLFLFSSLTQLTYLKKRYERDPVDEIEEVIRVGSEKEIRSKDLFLTKENALKIGKGGSSSPWWIELIGQLNPLSVIEKMILIMRDWKTEVEKNKISNKLELMAVRGKILENAMKEIEIIKDLRSFMVESGVDKDKVNGFLMTRIEAILSNTHGSDNLDALHPNKYLSSSTYVLLESEYKEKKDTVDTLRLPEDRSD